jgi:hypothetical protein
MTRQRLIQFETTSDDGAERVARTVAAACDALARTAPDGVRLAYWRVPDSRRFVAMIELADENANPLTDLEATRNLPAVIGECVDGGYPRPEVIEPVGSYGLRS